MIDALVVACQEEAVEARLDELERAAVLVLLLCEAYPSMTILGQLLPHQIEGKRCNLVDRVIQMYVILEKYIYI